MIDAYRQPYVPFYLTTREFFALCRKRLAPGGIVALNVSTVPGDTRLVDGIAGTLATEFPRSWCGRRCASTISSSACRRRRRPPCCVAASRPRASRRRSGR